MSARAQKAAMAQETLRYLQKGSYPVKGKGVQIRKSLDAAVAGSVLYCPEDFTPSFLTRPFNSAKDPKASTFSSSSSSASQSVSRPPQRRPVSLASTSGSPSYSSSSSSSSSCSSSSSSSSSSNTIEYTSVIAFPSLSSPTASASPNGKQVGKQRETNEVPKEAQKELKETQKEMPKEAPKEAEMNVLKESKVPAESSSSSIKTEITFSNETTLQAARRLALPENTGNARKLPEKEKSHVVVLNFASAKNPGGGFLGGSQAQEESLARSSGLYPCIAQKTQMYQDNKRSSNCAYFHYMIFSPLVPVFRKDNGELLEDFYEVSFITAPAPNAGVMMTREKDPQVAVKLIETILRERIDRILAVCAHHHGDTLVLGAYGCGVFKNDINMVARVFKELIFGKYLNVFPRIHFAVPDRIDIFQRSFAS